MIARADRQQHERIAPARGQRVRQAAGDHREDTWRQRLIVPLHADDALAGDDVDELVEVGVRVLGQRVVQLDQRRGRRPAARE